MPESCDGLKCGMHVRLRISHVSGTLSYLLTLLLPCPVFSRFQLHCASSVLGVRTSGREVQTSGKGSHPPSTVCPHPSHEPWLSFLMAAAVAIKDVIFYSILKPWLGEYLQVTGEGHPGGSGNGVTLTLYYGCSIRGWAPAECR